MVKYGLACEYGKEPLSGRDRGFVLLGIAVALLLIVLLFLFFVRIDDSSPDHHGQRRKLSAGQNYYLAYGDFKKSPFPRMLREYSPESFLYPDSVYPYSILVQEKQLAANMDFPELSDSGKDAFFRTDTDFSLSTEVLSPRPMVDNTSVEDMPPQPPPLTYPLFADAAGLIPGIPALALPDADVQRLAINPPSGPTVLRVMPEQDAAGAMTVLVDSSCGRRELDSEACRHLETFLNSSACPDALKSTLAICRVVWARAAFGDAAEFGSIMP